MAGPEPFEALVARTDGPQPWRRVVHAATGVVLALGPGAVGLAPRWTAVGFGAAAAGLLAADWMRLRVPAVNRAFFTVFRRLASPREARGVASSTWFVIGAALVWAMTPGLPAVAALLVLGLADPAAGLVGRRWGRTPLGTGSRLGSAVFVVVALALLWPMVGLFRGAVAALVAATAEAAPLRIDDNLTVPLATAATLQGILPPGLL